MTHLYKNILYNVKKNNDTNEEKIIYMDITNKKKNGILDIKTKYEEHLASVKKGEIYRNNIYNSLKFINGYYNYLFFEDSKLYEKKNDICPYNSVEKYYVIEEKYNIKYTIYCYNLDLNKFIELCVEGDYKKNKIYRIYNNLLIIYGETNIEFYNYKFTDKPQISFGEIFNKIQEIYLKNHNANKLLTTKQWKIDRYNDLNISTYNEYMFNIQKTNVNILYDDSNHCFAFATPNFFTKKRINYTIAIYKNGFAIRNIYYISVKNCIVNGSIDYSTNINLYLLKNNRYIAYISYNKKYDIYICVIELETHKKKKYKLPFNNDSILHCRAQINDLIGNYISINIYRTHGANMQTKYILNLKTGRKININDVVYKFKDNNIKQYNPWVIQEPIYITNKEIIYELAIHNHNRNNYDNYVKLNLFDNYYVYRKTIIYYLYMNKIFIPYEIYGYIYDNFFVNYYNKI